MEITMAREIDEKVHYDKDGRHFTVERRFDVSDDLHRARVLRDAQAGTKGENRLVGTIPMHLVNEWMKEAGVSPSDNAARAEILKKKILSGEFDKFRVWKGTF
jgi:hypothetical protein